MLSHLPLCRKMVLLALLTFFISAAQAQQLSGTITGENDQPLDGATIELKGSTQRTTSGKDGRWTLTTSIPPEASLVFSFTGYKQQELKFEGRSIINIKLEPTEVQLNEVIVTALGIRREEKSLGYAAQTVKESALKDAKTNNWANALSG